MSDKLSEKELDVTGVMDALGDFLREWYPHARVIRVCEAQAKCQHEPGGRYIRCETGGAVGFQSDFCLPKGQVMELGGVLLLARAIHADWSKRNVHD